MSRRIIIAEPSTPIKRVAEIMYENRVGSIIIVDFSGKVAGIFTERDLVRVVALGIDLSLPVEKVMTTTVITASLREDLGSVVSKMIENWIRHVPVVDETGRPIGMVSIRDALRAYIAGCSMP